MEAEILERDQACVYCGVSFAGPPARRGDRPSWEHIVNDETLVTLANIARCCLSCNASKGARGLDSWLLSRYCQRKGIHRASVAAVVQQALDASAGSGGSP